VQAETVSGFSVAHRLQEAPGNIAVSADGRVIISLHQFYEPRYSVVEVRPDGSITPFPNAAMNDRSAPSVPHLDSVLGVRADSQGIVWMLDNGMRGQVPPKLVGWDLSANKLHKVIEFPPSIAPKGEFVNDMAIDTRRHAIYISDPANGQDAGLIVVDLQTNKLRRVLQGHAGMLPEPIDLVIDGRPLQIKDKTGALNRPHIGVNPITMDAQFEWVYYGPMHGLSLYRIKAADLANAALTDADLAKRIERYSSKPISDGISIDNQDNIYLGDLANNAIGVITPDRKYQTLAKSKDLSWVDSFSFGPRGQLYAIVNRLHQTAMLNGGDAVSKPPYFVLKVQSLAPGTAGR
jgi:sugar lactone lactonase YvrE